MMQSFNPATGDLIWEGEITSKSEIAKKIETAKKSFDSWSKTHLETRVGFLEEYARQLEIHKNEIAEAISKETGKPLWEAKNEVAAMIAKIPISIEAYHLRCTSSKGVEFRPHGPVAVLGPFNFPGHLPNGHIVPALLAGNTVLFKPSEQTPSIGEWIAKAFSHLPSGVFQLVQGGAEAGVTLTSSKDIKGVFFTGSAGVGQSLQQQNIPGRILALEMGGNNPLVISKIHDIKAAAYTTIQSAFLTTGQRCSCARRLILTPDCPKDFIPELIRQMKNIKIGAYNDSPEPFMGPLINEKAAEKLLLAQAELKAAGAKLLHPMAHLKGAFVSPALIDVTSISNRKDEEYFGPFLQLIYCNSFADALAEANNTAFGLSAGLLSDSEEEWQQFYPSIRAGVINWNTPLTGASSKAPFGGLGKSGNFRPSASLAADYCSYPVASMQKEHLNIPSSLTPGISL
jgi:succinylglutamic semialdehyde dehydrogenase